MDIAGGVSEASLSCYIPRPRGKLQKNRAGLNPTRIVVALTVMQAPPWRARDRRVSRAWIYISLHQHYFDSRPRKKVVPTCRRLDRSITQQQQQQQRCVDSVCLSLLQQYVVSVSLDNNFSSFVCMCGPKSIIIGIIINS